MDELKVKERDGKEPVLELNKSSREITPQAPNLVHLMRAKDIPLACNDCKFRPKEKGGEIGQCPVYKEDSLCRIRADTRKIIEKYQKDSPDEVLPLLIQEFNSNFEKLKFFETIENVTGTINPEVTKRINALVNVGKIIHEFKLKKTTIEMQEKTTLSDDQKREIARMLTMTTEKVDDV